jgi:hypothetical protein
MFGVRQQKRLRSADVALLAELDRLHDTLSGPATKAIWMAPRASITLTPSTSSRAYSVPSNTRSKLAAGTTHFQRHLTIGKYFPIARRLTAALREVYGPRRFGSAGSLRWRQPRVFLPLAART